MKKWLTLLLLLFFIFGCEIKQQKGIVIKEVIINELEDNEHPVSFTVQNLNESIADCYVNIGLEDRNIIRDLGIVNAKSEEKKQFLVTSKCDKIEIKPVCRWITDQTAQNCNTGSYTKRRICELVLGKPELQQCLSHDNNYGLFCIALITKNAETCDYIINDRKKIWCKAYVTGEDELCSTIQTEQGKDWCYADIGMNFKDLAICEKITDEKSKTSCTAAATKNPKLCLEGAEQYKVSCILNIVEATGDKESCAFLSDKQKDECLEQF